jgi:plasmid stability protein
MDDKIIVELDSETLDALSRQADAHGRSIDEEVRDIVRQAVPIKEHSDRDPVEWARSIRAMTPKGVKQTDSLTLLREDRDR